MQNKWKSQWTHEKKKNDRLLTNIQCFRFYLHTILFIQSQNGFLHFAMNGVALMSAIFLQEWWVFLLLKKQTKKTLVTQKSCLCWMISFAFLSCICIYIHIHDKKGVIHIYMNNPFLARSVSLFRLEQRSLSVGKNFGLAKTLLLWNIIF